MKKVFTAQAIQTAIEKSLPDFQKIAGNGAVRTQDSVRRQFQRDESHFIAPPPSVVLEPTSTEQVSQLLQICNDRQIPVVPFGTGTGLEGGSMSTLAGVCMSTQQIGGEPTLREQDFVCSVKPSTTRLALNEAIKSSGLFFPVDPGADASVCGMVATSASGTNAIRYGTMKENVVNLEVVLADGTILDTKGKGRCPRKSSAGFNFTELFVGSEGTLGIITQATVRAPPPSVVLEPTSTEQVSQLLRICNDRQIPVVPFGTGTGLEGGSMSTLAGVCMSTQQIAGEPTLREQDFVCSVKPSTTRLTLNEAIKTSGLFFPVDPGADASVCGMAATSASGTNAIRYGTMKENVVLLKMVESLKKDKHAFRGCFLHET
uniref:FAD-binding PCMH-type domain-containing protein n=1 Tax=Caenorhabditis japonica TaxID=281687 RepID=A0A8R1IB50_CAEJA